MDAGLTGRFRTPWGEGGITVRHGHLVGVELPPAVPGAEAGGPDVDLIDRRALGRWADELEAYFRGERLAWTEADLSLDELDAGTFQRAVYSALLTVSPGMTVSYGTLAEMAGYPRAARAVGNAMAANPVPIVIPCHRVIRSDGNLGDYGTDPTWKERLLEHERRFAGQGRGDG